MNVLETPSQDSAGSAEIDLDRLLEISSRTFALSIPYLPEPTRRQVGLAYLLFRIADTFEDAELWPRQARLQALEDFDALLLGQRPLGDAPSLVEGWLAEPPCDHEGYLELLRETPGVLTAFFDLDPEARQLVRDHTLRTSRGMAGFVRRSQGDGRLRLDDLPDLQEYCYIVAGIVGEMLTELFLLDRESLDPAAVFLRQRARAFGEGLQLVNILKDSADDADHGRSYLPKGVDRGTVFDLARRDLEEATRYVHALQDHGAPDGVVAFTALPVQLAWRSLDRVEEAGPGAKLTRPEVFELVARVDLAIREGRPAAAPP